MKLLQIHVWNIKCVNTYFPVLIIGDGSPMGVTTYTSLQPKPPPFLNHTEVKHTFNNPCHEISKRGFNIQFHWLNIMHTVHTMMTQCRMSYLIACVGITNTQEKSTQSVCSHVKMIMCWVVNVKISLRSVIIYTFPVCKRFLLLLLYVFFSMCLKR